MAASQCLLVMNHREIQRRYTQPVIELEFSVVAFIIHHFYLLCSFSLPLLLLSKWNKPRDGVVELRLQLISAQKPKAPNVSTYSPLIRNPLLGASIFNGVHQRPLGNTVAAVGNGKKLFLPLFFFLLQHPQVPVAIFLSPPLTLYLRMRFFLDWLVVAIISRLDYGPV